MSHVPLEIWGCIEPAAADSIERFVGFERIASLGVNSLRVPIHVRTNWENLDGLFRGLRGINVRPVVALSGPARGFAELARTAAARYPWVGDFSIELPAAAPAGEDFTSYRTLLDDVGGVRDAMLALRAQNAQARIVATMPLVKSYGPSQFSDRAEFANACNLLTLDLLCGTLDKNPSMQRRLAHLRLELDQRDRERLTCPPDLLDFSYDVTNERWLDHRGDLEAVRICVESIAGVGELLAEMWERYGLPLGITSAFSGSGEQQLRWLRDMHRDVSILRSHGTDVRTIGIPVADVRSGAAAFDLRAQRPRETSIASYARFLTQKTTAVSPAANGRGWWRSPSRIEYAPVMRDVRPVQIPFVEQPQLQRPIVILGIDDPLADVVAAACRERSLAHELWGEAIVNSQTFAAKLVTAGAWAVFDCTAADNAWLSEMSEDEMRLAEHFGTVAHACRQAGLPIVAVSSPLVFDGRPFDRTEDDATHPRTPRGSCYVEIEELLKIVVPKSLVLRCGIPFGGVTRMSWHDAALLRLLQGSRACIFSDYVSAVHRGDLARVALDLLIDGERGIVHAFNPGESNAVEILSAALQRVRNGAKIERIAEAANRSRYMLGTARIAPLRSLDDALDEWTESASRLESAS